MININVSVKSILRTKKKISWRPSTCTCENDKYLKHISDDSVIACDEIMSVTDSVSTSETNTISTNVTSIASVNSDDKKVRYKMDLYIHTILLVIIGLFYWPILLAVITISLVLGQKQCKGNWY